jgi:hypothetical protein
MKRYTTFCVFILLVFLCQNSFAQIHAGAFLGFKSYSLNAVTTLKGAWVSNGSTTSPATDAGGTVFNFGGTAGYTSFTSGIYSLDLDLLASFSSISFFQRGYDKSNGTGAFAAAGLSGGTTSVFAFDLMGINRLTIPTFKLIEPYAGLGLGFNIYSTGDITVQGQTAKGSSSMKLGMIIVYGANLHVTPLLTPYIRFSHLIPFGNETQLTDDPNLTVVVKDVPGYFGLTAGVMLSI